MPFIKQLAKYFSFFLVLFLLYSCDRYEGGAFEPTQLRTPSLSELEAYADTTVMLKHLAAFESPSQQVDSLLHFAEWLKNYQEDISLFYAQMAYDIATENNWNIPRAFSANRLAWSKAKKIRFGENIEDAIADAKISRRLLINYPVPFWEADINNLFGYLYKQSSQVDSSRFYFTKALNSASKLASQPALIEWNKAMILHNLGTTYNREDKDKVHEFYTKSDSIFQQLGNWENRTRLWVDWADFYTVLSWDFEKADSLLQFCLTYGEANNDTDLLGKAFLQRGSLYQKKFSKDKDSTDFAIAVEMLQKSLTLQIEDDYHAYSYLGYCFYESWYADLDTSHVDSAIYYYKLALESASQEGSIEIMKNISKSLSAIYPYGSQTAETAIALFLDANYQIAIDTITINAKDAYKRINDVEQRDLRLSAANKRRNQQLEGLLILLAAGVLFIIALQRLQNRRLKAEMSALRAQINPHFISNSLNAIENLVNKGDNRSASKYLVHFSRLTRQILNGSASGTVSLAQEVKTLKHFLALEQLRFRDKLTYEIDIDADLEAEKILIPAMIFQPYVENSIWHGIKPKPEGGHIKIQVFREENILKCIIEDNGIGREAARVRKAASVIQQESKGMQITQDRLKSMGRVKGPPLQIEDQFSEDGSAAGTKVILRFPYKLMKTNS